MVIHCLLRIKLLFTGEAIFQMTICFVVILNCILVSKTEDILRWWTQ